MTNKKVTKKSTAATTAKNWNMSWKNLLFSASVVLNIAFIVVFCTMIFTNKLDPMFIEEGLKRYCSDVNDSAYAQSPADVQALRNFTCAKGDAKPYYDSALKIYLFTKGINQN